MQITLLNHTPLHIASTAIRKCWDSGDKSDTVNTNDDIGTKDRELIDRVGNKFKHSSTLEHLSYTFDIDGVSRALLQELARHRMANISVKSTRYTLKELKDEEPFVAEDLSVTNQQEARAKNYLVFTGNSDVDYGLILALNTLVIVLNRGVSNDKAKYCLPEAYKTSLVWTINARSLQNFLHLRTSKAALWEIRDLANELFNKLPEEHKYLFEDSLSES